MTDCERCDGWGCRWCKPTAEQPSVVSETTSDEAVRVPCWMVGVDCDHAWCKTHGVIKKEEKEDDQDEV